MESGVCLSCLLPAHCADLLWSKTRGPTPHLCHSRLLPPFLTFCSGLLRVMASDTDSDFHSVPSSPRPSLSQEPQSAQFSDEEPDQERSIFHSIVEELITDLSSQEKQEPPVSPQSQSQRSPPLSLNSCSSSSPDFLPVASQRILSAGAEGKASRQFFATCQFPDEQCTLSAAGDADLTMCQTQVHESDDPIDQLYLDQCCEWFRRETRSTTDHMLYPGVGCNIRAKKRKL